MEAEGKNTKEEIDKTFFSQSWNNLQCLLTKEAFTEPFQAFLTNSRKTEKKEKYYFMYHNYFPDNFSSLLSLCEIPHIFNIWKVHKGQNDLFVPSSCSYFYITISVFPS